MSKINEPGMNMSLVVDAIVKTLQYTKFILQNTIFFKDFILILHRTMYSSDKEQSKKSIDGLIIIYKNEKELLPYELLKNKMYLKQTIELCNRLFLNNLVDGKLLNRILE